MRNDPDYKILPTSTLVTMLQDKCTKKGALGELYLRFSEQAHLVALTYFKDSQLSSDAVSHVFTKIASSKNHLSTIRDFPNYLHTAIKNYYISNKKKLEVRRKHQATLYLHYDNFNSSIVENNALKRLYGDSTKFKTIKKAIKTLPDAQKMCIELFYFEQLSYKQIVIKTNYPYNKVRSNIQNGLRNIKKFINLHYKQ